MLNRDDENVDEKLLVPSTLNEKLEHAQIQFLVKQNMIVVLQS